MRRRGLIALVAVVVAFLGVRGFVAWQDTNRPTNDAAADTGLDTRKVEAGEVTVEIEPRVLEDGRAEFAVTFDTHSVELDLDVAANAELTVHGTTWGDPTWTGDAPGGHHRTGVLHFTGTGPLEGDVQVRISGLPEPVVANWTLEG